MIRMHKLLQLTVIAMVGSAYSFQPVVHFSHIFPHLVNKQISSQEKETVRALLEEVNKEFDNNPELIKQPLPSLFLQALQLLEKEKTNPVLQKVHIDIDALIRSSGQESRLFDCIGELNVHLGTMFGSYSPPLSQVIKEKIYYKPLQWARRNKKYSVPLAIAAGLPLTLWLIVYLVRMQTLYGVNHKGKESKGRSVSLAFNDDNTLELINHTHRFVGCTHVVFAHGFGGDALACTPYYSQGIFQPKRTIITTFDFQEVLRSEGDNRSKDLWWGNVSMAQQGDIERLHKAVISAYAKTGSKVLGFGVSRGAATWLTTLGSYPALSEQVAGVIAESPFASLYDVFLDMTGNIPLASGLIAQMARYAKFPQHSFSGPTPLNKLAAIPHSVPLLFVHSKQDTLVRINHSRRLYTKLKEGGHPAVYLVELEDGSHANLWGSTEKVLYQNVVQAFLKKCGVPADEESANRADLSAFQPSIEEVTRRMQKR